MTLNPIPKVFIEFWKRLGLRDSIVSSTDREIHFASVTSLERTPSLDSVSSDEFVVVSYKGEQRWTMFLCPCGCRKMISLPLNPPHRPRWTVYVDDVGRPSLFPSVWQNVGCMSHFVIHSGRIIWARNSGMSPFDAHPNYYEPRLPDRT